MVTVGVHVSIAGSIAKSVDRAVQTGCDTFQIFSRNPRGWAFKDLSSEEITAFSERLHAAGIGPAVDHMPYLPNLATPREEIYEKSVVTLKAELHRCGQLQIPYLVTHLGHHLGEGMEGGRRRVMDAVNQALLEVDNAVMLLLENTAGEKNGVGSTFEDLRAVLDGMEVAERVGICFDTCHAFAAGYDLRTPESIRDVFDQLEDQVGLSRLHLIHLNDSKGDLGSGLDRHEHIGMGFIGQTGFRHLLHTPIFQALPLLCETPVDERRDDTGNIRMVRELAG
jgi:deoxyribonuclease-4